MIKPQQRLRYTEKDEQWKKNSYDYYSNACIDAIERERAALLYRAANGEMDEGDYTYVTNPLNEDNPSLQGYPAKMRNYDIISENINTIIGDFIDRFFPPIVYAINSNYDEEQFEAYKQEISKLLQREFINTAVRLGAPLEEERINESFEKIQRKIKNLPNVIAKQGQSAINYIIEYCELVRKFRYQLYDFICTARCFGFKDVNRDEIETLVINPADIGYLCSPQMDFIEDGEAVRVRYSMSPSEVYDKFQDKDGFTEEVKRYIDEQYGDTFPSINVGQAMTDMIDPQKTLAERIGLSVSGKNIREGVPVEHTQWRSSRCVYEVMVGGLNGKPELVEYDETYIPLPGESYNKVWRDHIWEGYKIADRFYIGIRPVEVASGDKPRLQYNGLNAHTRFTDAQSLVEKILPYQKKYNIVSYTMEATLNKSLDKLIIFPLSLIPEKEGWDENTVMYYAKALSFLFVNDANNTFATAVNGLKGVDLSLNQYVMQFYQILAAIKQQAESVFGLSPQRKADISNSAGATTSELAVQRSYVINELLYTEFEEFQAREYQGLIDLSQFAFSDGKRAMFINRQGSQEILDIVNPEKYCNARFGIFAKNGKREINKLQQLKANVQAFAQNLPDPELIAKIINSDNYSELMEYMSNMSDELKAKAEQAAQNQQQLEQASMQLDAQYKQDDLEYKYYKTDADNLRAERVALINSIKSNLEAISPIVDSPDSLKTDKEMLSLYQDRQKMLAENFFKLKEIETKEADLRLKEEKIRSDERIAKEANKVALKNKVSGEK